MKKIPMLIMIAAQYLCALIAIPLFIVGSKDSTVDLESFSLVSIAVLSVIFLVNDVYALILPKLGFSARRLFFWSMLMKLFNLPIHILSLYACYLLLSPENSFELVAMFLVFFNYFMLLPSALYGLSGILKSPFNPYCGYTAQAVCGLFNFIFVADVISSAYLYFSYRKLPEMPVMWYVQYPYMQNPYQNPYQSQNPGVQNRNFEEKK